MAEDVEADGMSFNAETVTAARITQGAEYEGVGVRFQGGLGNAQVPLQIDIGFGDVIVPGPSKVVYRSSHFLSFFQRNSSRKSIKGLRSNCHQKVRTTSCWMEWRS